MQAEYRKVGWTLKVLALYLLAFLSDKESTTINSHSQAAPRVKCDRLCTQVCFPYTYTQPSNTSERSLLSAALHVALSPHEKAVLHCKYTPLTFNLLAGSQATTAKPPF